MHLQNLKSVALSKNDHVTHTTRLSGGIFLSLEWDLPNFNNLASSIPEIFKAFKKI